MASGPEFTVAILGEEILPSIRINRPEPSMIMRRSISLMRHSILPRRSGSVTRGQFAGISAETWTTLGCKGWGRIDVMLDSDDSFICWKPIPHRV